MVYVIIWDNGESWDDHSWEIAGIFTDKEIAIATAAKVKAAMGYGFTDVEDWTLNKLQAHYQYHLDKILEPQ